MHIFIDYDVDYVYYDAMADQIDKNIEIKLLINFSIDKGMLNIYEYKNYCYNIITDSTNIC